MILNALQNYIPESIIAVAIILCILISFFKNAIFKEISNYVTFISLVSATYLLIETDALPSALYMNLLKILICISGFAILFFESKKIFIEKNITFNILLLSAILFSMLIISSTDFLTLYVNVELLSIVTYFLISFDPKTDSMKESLKYLITNIIASALCLTGIAFIYGLSGNVDFNGINARINNIHMDYTITTYIIPYTFLISGLAFKLGMFPLANWLIDVYKKTNTKILVFISTIPKIAIFGVFLKILNAVSWFEITLIISVLGLITAFFGALYAIKEHNLKTLMACSSYVNIAYIFIAIGFYTKISISTVLFYLIVYIIANIGAFSGISVLEYSNYHNNNFDFQGYFYNNPLFAINFAICIISLLGFPVTSGFIAKIYLISGILNSGILAVPILFLMIGSMIIAIYFYINILKKMFSYNTQTDNAVIETSVNANKVILYLVSTFTLFIGFIPAWLIKTCESIVLYMS